MVPNSVVIANVFVLKGVEGELVANPRLLLVKVDVRAFESKNVYVLPLETLALLVLRLFHFLVPLLEHLVGVKLEDSPELPIALHSE